MLQFARLGSVFMLSVVTPLKKEKLKTSAVDILALCFIPTVMQQKKIFKFNALT
jgi:hypothetical protein